MRRGSLAVLSFLPLDVLCGRSRGARWGSRAAVLSSANVRKRQPPRMRQSFRHSVRTIGLGVAALIGAAFHQPAAAQTLAPANPDSPLSLGAPVRPVKGEDSVYIVKLRQPGAAAAYKTSLAALAAVKSAPGVQVGASLPAATQDRLRASVGAAGNKISSFRYAMNGFAAKLTAEQVSELARSGAVERIWPDTDRQLSTLHSAIFLGLENPSGGLRADLGLR